VADPPPPGEGGDGVAVTRLAERLTARIRAGGPITVADYMAACLGDLADGYYTTREPFGSAGDFVTAPEVSQMFGELIGLWCIATWEAMGSPGNFVLAELGPGRGTLMADLLRAARVRPGFVAAAGVNLVETSLRLREAQRQALAGVDASWHDSVSALPDAPLILVANEFFDALPIRQFVRTGDGWAERVVGIADDGGITWGLRALPSRHDIRLVAAGGASGPAILEVSPAATEIMEIIATRIVTHGGTAIIIDYGYEGPAFGDTLQAVKGHAHVDPLATPGEADLTAHVDFAALASAARAGGANPRPRISQANFLRRLGIIERADRLASGKGEAARGEIAAAVARLTAPSAMGEHFKVLAVSRPGLALPAFDADS
jgi:NADH dehydrogenase [ubiquinone] 1 alpha subcomplex assembly factor 7